MESKKKLDRQKEPILKLPGELRVPEIQKLNLSNGIQVFLIRDDGPKLLRIEFIFRSGKWFEPKRLVASSTNTLLNAGTKKYSSKELAEGLDFYGSYLQTYSEPDRAGMVLYCLSRYLNQALEFVNEIIRSSTFPEEELNIHLDKSRQQFQINRNKVSFLARQDFNSRLFGNKHAYGAPTELKDFEDVHRKDLMDFFKKFYNSRDLKISVSGSWTGSIVDELDHFFGKDPWRPGTASDRSLNYEISGSDPGVYITEKKDALQSAIRLGKRTINRYHKDFIGLSIVSVILGGYFGSRLMKNIREEKGYTYGIGAQLVSLENEGFLVIGSEVDSQFSKEAVEECMKEISLLRTEPVDKEELKLVKNYISGSWLRLFDGPMAAAEAFRVLLDYGLDEDYFSRAFQILQELDQERIMDLAKSYLKEEEFIHVIAGTY